MTPRCWRRCQKISGRPWWGSTAGLGSSPSPIATTKRDGVHCLLRPRLLCDILHREETATEIRVRACLLAVRQCILQRQAGNLAEPEPEHCVHLQKRPKRDRSLQHRAHRLSVRRAAPRCLISDEEATLPGLVGACCGSPRPFAGTLCACRALAVAQVERVPGACAWFIHMLFSGTECGRCLSHFLRVH